MKIKVVQVGFGSLGRQIFKEIYDNKNFQILQVIDRDPLLHGMDAGKPFKLNTKHKIQNSVALRQKPDIIIHSTVSKITKAYEQFKELLGLKTPIISTCEELVYPTMKNIKIANKIDALAKKNKTSVLGIGVNPGYLMDSLVITLSNLMSHVNKIEVSRTINLASRRKALQEKMMIGKKTGQFKKEKNLSGHVGLEESATMICDHFKIKPIIKKNIVPILAKKKIQTKFFNVKKGEIIGILESLTVKKENKTFLKMNLDMHLGARDVDEIIINGSQSINMCTSGINGDKSTIALLLNYIPQIMNKSGLYLVSSQGVIKFNP